MVLNGWHSDRRRERHLHTVIPLALMAGGFLAMGLSIAPWIVVPAYVVWFISQSAVQGTFWLIPSDVLHGRSAAVGVAAIGAWVANEGAKIAVSASESEVRAATVALQGVQKEAAGGQRTTVDVLNSQQDLILAKARLIGAQRDRVIASYTLLSAIGRLDVKTLSLNTPDYLPEVHYHQVRDAWHGLRTPSGQ